MVLRSAIGAEGDLTDDGLRTGLIAVLAIHVARQPASQQHVPEVRIELGALSLRAALDLNLAQPFIPHVLRIKADPVEVPVRQLGVKIQTGLFDAHVRQPDLQLDDLIIGRRKPYERLAVLAGSLCDLSKVLAVHPCRERLEGRIELGDEIERTRFGTTGRGAVGHRAFDLLVRHPASRPGGNGRRP